MINFMINYSDELNHQQYKAVLHKEGPALVLAGAGSGKTRIIIYRLANLIEEGIKTNEILLLTFTKKASLEMKKRVNNLLENDDSFEGGTFHSWGIHFINKYSKLLGYDQQLNIYDPNDCTDMIKLIISELVAKKEYDRKKNFMSADRIQDLFSAMNNNKIDLKDAFLNEDIDMIDAENVYNIFNNRKRANNIIDYDDIMALLLKLLQHEEFGKKIMDNYKYIMVDEFQDTNYIQNDLINAIYKHNKNIFVVGDDAQSIYAFRGAKVENILNFHKVFKDTKVYNIDINYRSSKEILDFSNEFSKKFRHNLKKNLISHRSFIGKKPKFLEFQFKNDECTYIIKEIKNKLKEDSEYRDFVILTRSSYLNYDIQAALTKENIPFRVFGGIRFFDRKHIKDFISYLKILNNSFDQVSFNRILNLIPRIGDKNALKIFTEIKKYNSIKDIDIEKLDIKLNDKIINFINVLKNSIDYMQKNDMNSLFENLKNYYSDLVKLEYNRLKELNTLKNIFLGYITVESFLLAINVDQSTLFEDDNENFLTVSTIHSSKGLEFKHVFILAVANGTFPSSKSIAKGELEEEKRLFYVACTRAKDSLYISNVNNSFKEPKYIFIEGIKNEFIERKKILKKKTFSNKFSNNYDGYKFE